MFPINIEGGIRSRLDAIFEPYVENLKGGNGGDVVDPFNEVTPFTGAEGTELPLSPMKSPWQINSQHSLPSTPKSAFSREGKEYENEVQSEGYGEGLGDVVEGFDGKVFNAAEKSIKYLVVTNTWRKMVTAMKDGSPRSSVETLT